MTGQQGFIVDLQRLQNDNVHEIIREAESFLGAQLSCGLAADQRAMTLSGALATIATAVFGAGLAAISADKPNYVLGAAALACGIVFIAALFFAVWSARPVPFNYVGNTPSSWDNEPDLYGPLAPALYQQAQHYAEGIEANGKVLGLNASWLRRALWASLAAPIVGLVFGLSIYWAV